MKPEGHVVKSKLIQNSGSKNLKRKDPTSNSRVCDRKILNAYKRNSWTRTRSNCGLLWTR